MRPGTQCNANNTAGPRFAIQTATSHAEEIHKKVDRMPHGDYC